MAFHCKMKSFSHGIASYKFSIPHMDENSKLLWTEISKAIQIKQSKSIISFWIFCSTFLNNSEKRISYFHSYIFRNKNS